MVPHSDRKRVAALTAFYGAAALLATFSSSAGRIVADNRYDQYSNPSQRLSHALWLWDGSRGLGRVREDWWPLSTWPLVALRGVGLPVWMAERIWHAAVLTALATGTVCVLRLFRPRVGCAHLIAGTAAGFGAFSASFLVPSNLAMYVAVAPWLVFAAVKGLRSTTPWRWAALGALLLAAPGNADPPGVVYALIGPGIAVAYVVAVERTASYRRALGLGARLVVLLIPLSAATLVKTWYSAGIFSQRLADTEAPVNSFFASSWSETFRGLGNWLTYFVNGGEFLKPQTVPYLASPALVALTFVPALVGLSYLAASRWRPRLLFAAMAGASAVLMVGAFPVNDRPPFGAGLLAAMESVGALAAFRNVYKSGAGLVLGTAILFGCGAEAAIRRSVEILRRPAAQAPPSRVGASRATAGAGVAAVAVVLVALAFPFWTGGLYAPGRDGPEPPQYWDDAMGWLDRQPEEGRVLVLPSSTRTQYLWGYVGDDIFDAGLERAHAVDTAVPLSTPEAANLLAEISRIPGTPEYEQGSLAPVLRRLGVRWVVLRNDLDWAAMGRPRPADYQPFREDPDFRLAESFGEPGRWAPPSDIPADMPADMAADLRADVEVESDLAPVEIFEVSDASAITRVEPDRPSLLVSGDGAAWPVLASEGLLEGGPVRYTGSMDTSALLDELDRGARLVVTDTARRRLSVLLGYEIDRSQTLAAGEELDRPAQQLFSVEGAESVATFGDAELISVTGAARGLGGSQPWYRIANAFDGDPRTAWVLNALSPVVGRVITVGLAEPAEVHRMQFLQAASLGDATGITGVRIGLIPQSGEPVVVDADLGRLDTIELPPTAVERIEIEITATAGEDLPVFGFSEIVVDGLDLTERIQVPDDVSRAATDDGELAAALEAAPVTLLLARASGGGVLPEERSIQRVVTVPAAGDYALSGRLTIPQSVLDDPALLDATLTQLSEPCSDIGIEIGSESLRATVAGDRTDLEAGDTVTFTGCEPVALPVGPVDLSTDPVLGVDRIRLDRSVSSDEPNDSAGGSVDPTFEVTDRGPTMIAGQLRAPTGALLVLGDGWAGGWHAVVDGVDLGPATAFDTLAGWRVPAAPGERDVRLEFRPDRVLRIALAVSGITSLIALALVFRPPRRLGDGRHEPAAQAVVARRFTVEWPPGPGWGRMAAGVVFAGCVGFAVARFWGAAAAVLGAAVAAITGRGRRAVGPAALAVVALAGASAATLLERWPTREGVTMAFALERDLAAGLGAVAGVLLLVAVVIGWVDERARSNEHHDRQSAGA